MSVNNELVEEIRKAIREEIRKTLLEAIMELIPPVNSTEQKEIEQKAGSPNMYREEDFIEWSGPRKYIEKR